MATLDLNDPKGRVAVIADVHSLAPRVAMARSLARAESAWEATVVAELPAYLVENYSWAYLRPASIAVFDHVPVVSAILWGRYRWLEHTVLAELQPGQNVLQAACVYGDLSQRLAGTLGLAGRLTVIDVAPIQVTNCNRKLRAYRNVQVIVADAAAPQAARYDAVVCFFLLHELPDDRKRRVVDALLDRVRPGGKVVFVDYHRPWRLHPLRFLMSLVFRWLEPFAKPLWHREISSFATRPDDVTWRKTTHFGGLYQTVVASRPRPAKNHRRTT